MLGLMLFPTPAGQERFRSVIQYMPAVIHTSQRMVSAARLLNIPVIVTEQNPKALGKTVAEINIEGFPNFPKTYFSMAIPEVNELLVKSETKSVVIFGIEAHVCVLQTVLDLLEKSYDVHVVADGVSSRNQSDRLIAIERLRQAGAFISSSESILFQLLGDATHPQFKAVSNLVKPETPDNGLAQLLRIPGKL